MKLLTINSSEKQAEICLKLDDKEIIHKMNETKSHSEFLLQEIENLLCENNLFINDLDTLSINVGPGSFTGVRIGISFIKAFMCAKKFNTVSVNNFELIDINLNNKPSEYFIVLSSNNEDFYFAKFLSNKIIYGSSNADYFNNVLNKENLQVFCKENELINFTSVKNINSVYVKKDSMLKASVKKIDGRNFLDINEICPLYIKKSQAEQGLQVKINNNLEILNTTTLEEVVELENKCFTYDAYSCNLLKEDLENENRLMFFAYYNNELIGYINYEVVLDEINLLKICVLPEFREYKIATQLMKKMIDYSKQNKIANIFLEVDEKNIPAKKLYEKFNFKKIDTRKNYYANGDNAIIYKLVL